MNDRTRHAWYLTGATAVGKSAVAMALARQLGAEILSLDSMALYRGMDIGTAKPGAADRAAVPHHLLDLVDPDEDFSVAQYLAAANQVLDDLHRRGVPALFVGGTPLYLKCLLRGMFDGPGADWNIRHELQHEAEALGTPVLHQRLSQVDPVAASNIHPHDTRRVVRALEVYRATGQPLSHQQMEFDDGVPADQCRVFVLRRERTEQHARIEQRVESMLAQGLVDEVRQLTADGRQLGRTAGQAVGYREVLDFLAGQAGEGELVTRMQARTRRFAKRQGTWFRSLSECRFVDIVGEADGEAIAQQIVAAGTRVSAG